MASIVNNDKLTFILTQHGLNRITEALEDSSVEIALTSMKLGTGDNEEYYEPNELQTALKGPIPGASFAIIDKELLEDELTVSLMTVIPASFGGYDIREVGIYETYNGEEVLFAISTQQPFVKPHEDDRYFISIDYYAFLRSQNLADIYDQIIIDSNTQFITIEDMEEFLRTVLFTQANLMEQIGHNSDVIGLGRSSQLYNKIYAERKYLGNFVNSSSFSTFFNSVGYNNIFSYWVFNKFPYLTSSVAINDIGPNGFNLKLSNNINNIETIYLGILPSLQLSTETFSLDASVCPSFLNDSHTEDTDFSMFFALEPLEHNSERTLLARSSYVAGVNIFEIKELANRSLSIRLFADSVNYMTFTSAPKVIPNERHALAISYNHVERRISCFINGTQVSLSRATTGTYNHLFNGDLETLYCFSAFPTESIYSDSPTEPTILYNADGTLNGNADWSIADNTVYYGNTPAEYDSTKNTATDTLYAWTYTNEYDVTYTVYTKTLDIAIDTKLYNIDYSEYTGTSFIVYEDTTVEPYTYSVKYGTHDTVQDSTRDIASITLYYWGCELGEQQVWADSATEPTALYTAQGNLYTGDRWHIVGTSVYYSDLLAEYTEEDNETLPLIDITSYILDANNVKTVPINSNVANISILLTKLPNNTLRDLSFLLMSALGTSPCVITSPVAWEGV